VPIGAFDWRFKELAIHRCVPLGGVPPGPDVAAPIVLIALSTKRP
jgi:hypothetical protein